MAEAQAKEKTRKPRRTGQRQKVGKDKHLIRVFLGRDTAGKRHVYTETFYGTVSQAETRIREVIRRHRAGEAIKVSKDTLELFLGEWLETKKIGVAETSYKAYEKVLQLYIRPRFGKFMLSALRAEDIQRAYNKMREDGLSVTTIRQAHTILGMIFKLAVLRKKLAGSPMVGVVLPRTGDEGETKADPAMSAEQVRRFLEESKGTRFERLFKLAFHVGCRPGELLALKWDDVDAEARTIRIDQSIVWRKSGDWYLKRPKTKLSRRSIPLTAAMVHVLSEERDAQAATRSGAGSGWQDHGFIFTTDRGEPHAQWKLRDGYKRILKAAGLPWHFNPYSARHTMATLLIAGGADLKSVSERLGHASPTMTLDVYSHVLPGRQAQVSEKIEQLLTVGNAEATKIDQSDKEETSNQ